MKFKIGSCGAIVVHLLVLVTHPIAAICSYEGIVKGFLSCIVSGFVKGHEFPRYCIFGQDVDFIVAFTISHERRLSDMLYIIRGSIGNNIESRFGVALTPRQPITTINV